MSKTSKLQYEKELTETHKFKLRSRNNFIELEQLIKNYTLLNTQNNKKVQPHSILLIDRIHIDA